MDRLRADDKKLDLTRNASRFPQQLLKFSFFHGPAFSAGLYLSIGQQKGWTAAAGAPWEYHFAETPIFRSATIV